MVQPKHQKSKSKKKPHVKRHGKCADLGEFRSQLDALGLNIVEVTSDGNCFFRALADQLEGNEENHRKYRNMAVQYILTHREDFEPFIEDGVPFDEYCKTMAEDGTWAGNMELQAASLVTRSNICIHRIREPRWYIRNFHSQARIMHLSYHNGEHYNSVRLKEDPCNGPAKTIVIKSDADLSATTRESEGAPKSKGGLSQCITHASSIKLVMAGSGCRNANKVEQILQQVDGDVNTAIEFLIAEQVVDDNDAEDGEQFIITMDGHSESNNCELTEDANRKNTYESDGPDSSYATSAHDDNNTQHNDKKIPRNKVCPCGSKKKYKACCGTKQNSYSESVINQREGSGKGRRERKQNKKGGPTRVAPLGKSEGNLPDMGALCI